MAPWASAETFVLGIENAGEVGIVGPYIGGPDGIPEGAKDLLSSEPLAPDDYIEIDLADDSTECTWTIGFSYPDGNTASFGGIDPCQNPVYLAAADSLDPAPLDAPLDKAETTDKSSGSGQQASTEAAPPPTGADCDAMAAATAVGEAVRSAFGGNLDTRRRPSPFSTA